MINVNNRPQEYDLNMTIQDLLDKNRFTYSGIFVKINGVIIEEDEFDRVIQDGDDVKVIHICHGG